jgi:integrase
MSTLAPRRALGSVRYQTARGRWEIRLREKPGALPTSTYIRGPETAELRRAAEEKLAERIAGLGRGVRHTPRRLTVGAWLDQWLEEKRAGDRTLEAYRTRVELYLKPTLGRIKLADLTPADVRRAMRELERMPGERVDRLSAGSIKSVHVTLSASLTDAWRDGHIGVNVARLASVPRSATYIEPPTQTELDRILEELEPHTLYPLFLTLRWTGARLGEILGLERRFLDLEARTLTIHRQPRGRALKTRTSRRTLVIPQSVADELARVPHRLGSDLVFTTANGRPIDPRWILTVFDHALEASGARPSEHADLRKYRPHDLRHAFATMLLEAAVPPATVAAWLGHASLRELDRYGHVTPAPGGDASRRVLEAFGDDALTFLPRWTTNRVRTTNVDHQRQTR